MLVEEYFYKVKSTIRICFKYQRKVGLGAGTDETRKTQHTHNGLDWVNNSTPLPTFVEVKKFPLQRSDGALVTQKWMTHTKDWIQGLKLQLLGLQAATPLHPSFLISIPPQGVLCRVRSSSHTAECCTKVRRHGNHHFPPPWAHTHPTASCQFSDSRWKQEQVPR